MTTGTSTVDGAGYAAQKARDNGAPEWLAFGIFLMLMILFCVCEIARRSPQKTNLRVKSALDQEAVSFMTDERE